MRTLFAVLALLAPAWAWAATTYTSLPYGSDVAQQLDVYLPDGELPAPVVLILHGGGWVTGDKCAASGAPDCMFPSAILQHVRAHFLAEGFVVVVANFRAAPNSQAGQAGQPFPAAVNDVDDVLAWIVGPAGRAVGCLPEVAVVGESSGANLAGLAAVAGATPVVAMVGYSGLYDLTLRRAGTDGPSDNQAINGRVKEYLGCEPAACLNTAIAASPYWRLERDVPVYLVAGELDPLVPTEQSIRMHEGTPGSRLSVVRGAPHGGSAFTTPAVSGPVYSWLEAQFAAAARPTKPSR